MQRSPRSRRRSAVVALAAALLFGTSAVLAGSALAGEGSDLGPFAKLKELLGGSDAGKPDSRVVATVNGEPITADRLTLGLLAADAGFVDLETGTRPDADRLLERAIRDVLLRQEAERLGLEVSDAEVTAFIELAIVAPLRDPAVPREMKELTEELSAGVASIRRMLRMRRRCGRLRAGGSSATGSWSCCGLPGAGAPTKRSSSCGPGQRSSSTRQRSKRCSPNCAVGEARWSHAGGCMSRRRGGAESPGGRVRGPVPAATARSQARQLLVDAAREPRERAPAEVPSARLLDAPRFGRIS